MRTLLLIQQAIPLEYCGCIPEYDGGILKYNGSILEYDGGILEIIR
ncbi:MAG: hypothetical protein LBV64_06430 [Mediterranea sp.]|nr:hypothetical protein [Mediterranea sp.]